MRKVFFLIITFIFLISCNSKKETANNNAQKVEIDPFLYKTGKIEKGDVIATSLRKLNFENQMVYDVIKEFKKIFNVTQSMPADSFWVKYDTLNQIHEFKYYPNDFKIYNVVWDSANVYHSFIDTIKFEKVIKYTEGEIKTSLYQALIDAGEGPNLIMQLTQILQWDIDFFIDPQIGDKFKIVYEQYERDGKFVKYGKILTASYINKGKEYIPFYFKNDKGNDGYYDENGKSFQKAFLKSPLNYKRITSKFGKRVHPVTRKVSFHSGVDYAAAYGTPIEAVADGVVIHAGWRKQHTGNTVIIRHANGYKTLYGHMSKFGRFKKGMRVKQHDIIGYVGSTGRSTGNHLHYTVYYKGKPINPLKIKNVSGPPVKKSEMERFKIEINYLKNLLSHKGQLVVNPTS